MAIDLRTEQILSLKEAAERVPGGRCSATIENWIEIGCFSRANGRVFLESVKLGGRRVTSWEALERFFELIDTREVRDVKDDSEVRGLRPGTA